VRTCVLVRQADERQRKAPVRSAAAASVLRCAQHHCTVAGAFHAQRHACGHAAEARKGERQVQGPTAVQPRASAGGRFHAPAVERGPGDGDCSPCKRTLQVLAPSPLSTEL
jgi:tRNA C32,U32 (ribose-2'-O)-methylase TrmJ